MQDPPVPAGHGQSRAAVPRQRGASGHPRCLQGGRRPGQPREEVCQGAEVQLGCPGESPPGCQSPPHSRPSAVRGPSSALRSPHARGCGAVPATRALCPWGHPAEVPTAPLGHARSAVGKPGGVPEGAGDTHQLCPEPLSRWGWGTWGHLHPDQGDQAAAGGTGIGDALARRQGPPIARSPPQPQGMSLTQHMSPHKENTQDRGLVRGRGQGAQRAAAVLDPRAEMLPAPQPPAPLFPVPWHLLDGFLFTAASAGVWSAYGLQGRLVTLSLWRGEGSQGVAGEPPPPR